MIVSGNGIYEICADCGRLVKLNKWLFGSLHLCLTEEDRKSKSRFRDGLMGEGQAARNERARGQK